MLGRGRAHTPELLCDGGVMRAFTKPLREGNPLPPYYRLLRSAGG